MSKRPQIYDRCVLSGGRRQAHGSWLAVPQPSRGRPLIAARPIISLTRTRTFSSSDC